MAKKKAWTELSSAQRAAVVAGAAAEAVLTAWAVRDLVGRPAAAVRGPKALWGVAMVVQPVGPVAYLVYGRR